MKKLLSTILALVMVCSTLLPYCAFAGVTYPIDMSNEKNWGDGSLVYDCSLYTSFHDKSVSEQFNDQIHFTDKNGHALQKNTDYTISAYSDAARTVPTTVDNRGKYYLTINFSGNYYGSYNTEYALYPYIDSTDNYHKISSYADASYSTNYDAMVTKVQTALENRYTSVTYKYATTASKYGAADGDKLLFNEVLKKAFTSEVTDPLNGDYLYRSIYSYSAGHSADANSNDYIGSTNYYPMSISLGSIKYYTTKAQDTAVRDFITQFNAKYITSGMTPYEKVKTIYDFVVRNAVYDTDVFTGKYASSTTRYKIAHSAYGAIYGSLIAEGKSISDYDWSTSNTVQNQKVPAVSGQGLAVCEGYSKLFYAMCIANGIECHIVDGDYTSTSGHSSDPHEWNYVRLDDGSGSGMQWYQVDTTFASQTSFKIIEYVNYDYFLKGSGNTNFSDKKHQQPYKYRSIDFTSLSNYSSQLYDWYGSTYKSSVADYKYPSFSTSSERINGKILVVRSYTYNGKNYSSYLYLDTSDPNKTKLIYIDENGVYLKDAKGFSYNGLNTCKYSVTVPYVVNGSVAIGNSDRIVNVGTYGAQFYGYPFNFDVVPMDMNTNYKSRNIQKTANYTGAQVSPATEILDGFGRKLANGRDYDVKVYSDSAHTKPTQIKNMGKYYVVVEYKGNYTGKYNIVFTMDKIKLSQLGMGTQNFVYLPSYLRKQMGISNIKDYFLYGAKSSPLKIGDLTIYPTTDYTVSYSGGMKYGDTGTLVLSGASGSTKVLSGNAKNVSYKISKKYSISKFNLNGAAATNKVYTYTGSAIKPTTFANINKYLVKGTEYKITGYSSCTKAGKAYVTIEGINGCSGTAKMFYTIGKASINDAKLTTSVKKGKLTYTLKYKNKKLVKGTDYKESRTKKGKTLVIKITGKGNFKDSRTINVKTS